MFLWLLCFSPYETGYTYASSLSYKRSLKAEDYVIPQLNRKQRYKFLYWELNTEWITNTDYITFPLRKYGQLSIDALTSLTSNSLGRIHDLLLVILSFLLALLQYTLTKVVQLLLLPVVLLLKASQMLMKGLPLISSKQNEIILLIYFSCLCDLYISSIRNRPDDCFTSLELIFRSKTIGNLNIL
jgi:hypothetical protein